MSYINSNIIRKASHEHESQHGNAGRKKHMKYIGSKVIASQAMCMDHDKGI